MQHKLPLVLALLGTALSGCGTFPRGGPDEPNRGLVSVNQPVVSRTDYILDVPASGYDGIAAADAQRLQAWFQSLNLRYGDTVYVDDPQGSDPSRRAAVGAVIGRYGLLVADGAPLTQGSIRPGDVRVIVSRREAYVPNCPNWSRPSQPEFDGSQDSNYGCATNSNLAAMIANPEDLIQGREVAGAVDPYDVNKGLNGYRTRPATGLSGLKAESAGAK